MHLPISVYIYFFKPFWPPLNWTKYTHLACQSNITDSDQGTLHLNTMLFSVMRLRVIWCTVIIIIIIYCANSMYNNYVQMRITRYIYTLNILRVGLNIYWGNTLIHCPFIIKSFIHSEMLLLLFLFGLIHLTCIHIECGENSYIGESNFVFSFMIASLVTI